MFQPKTMSGTEYRSSKLVIDHIENGYIRYIYKNLKLYRTTCDINGTVCRPLEETDIDHNPFSDSPISLQKFLRSEHLTWKFL